jgi:DNA-binding PadR family transcriptional regulator
MDHTLLILGLLKLEEMHGYQLGDLIDKRLKYLTDLKKPTLYHLLAKLESAGQVTKSVSRAGNRPERYTYRLTKTGAARFQELLRQNLQDAHAAYFNDDIGLLFLSEIPAAAARGYLEQKRARVDAHIAEIAAATARHDAGSPAYFTLRHHELHLETERAWLAELIAQMKKRAARQNIIACLTEADTPKRKK